MTIAAKNVPVPPMPARHITANSHTLYRGPAAWLFSLRGFFVSWLLGVSSSALEKAIRRALRLFAPRLCSADISPRGLQSGAQDQGPKV